jgi:hypothetical protein
MLSLIRAYVASWSSPKPLRKMIWGQDASGRDIASCLHCVKLLNNRWALTFITHVVDDHKLDHEVAIEVLDRVYRERISRHENKA